MEVTAVARSFSQSSHRRARVPVLLLLILLLVAVYNSNVMVTAVLNIAHPLNRHSNELKQFERYESLLGNDELMKTYLTKWNDCINSVSNNVKNTGCRETISESLKKETSLLENPLIAKFVRDTDSNDVGYYLPDCKYKVDFELTSHDLLYNDEDHSNYFIFNVRAHSCKTSYFESNSKFKGGASFDIHASNIFHMVNCEVEDNFDDSYEVFCPLSKTLNTHHNSHLNQAVVQNNAKVANHHTHKTTTRDISPCSCFALSIILDYEHFDAFSEFDYNYGRPALNHIIIDDDDMCVCNNGTVTQSNSDSNASINFKHSQVKELISDIANSVKLTSNQDPRDVANGKRSTFSSAWIRRLGEPASASPVEDKNNWGLYSGRKHLVAKDHPGNCKDDKWGNFDYAWTGSGNTFPTKDKFLAYFSNTSIQVTRIVGESHARYMWDIYYYFYYGEDKLEQLDRKHGTMSSADGIPALHFSPMYFSTDAADYISTPALKCVPSAAGHEKDPANVVVVQGGAWDLWITPVRNVIRNPNSMTHLVKAIKDWANNSCSVEYNQNRLIYISTQPTPRCPKGNFECEGGRGYRNNYAIAALDQYVQRELIQTRSDIIHYIDASRIILPKNRFVSSSCNLHYLCHVSGKDMQFSQAGLALAGEVLRCIMAKELGHMDNLNCLTLAQLGGSPEELHHVIMRERRHQGHADVRFDASKAAGDDLTNSATATATSTTSTSTHYYHIEGNVAREIEDSFTYDLIKDRTHIKVDSLIDTKQPIENYPMIKFYKIPSRMEGKRYRPLLAYKNLPSSYVINKNGLREPVIVDASPNKDVAMGIITVRNDDLLDIQLANECNSLV